MLTIADLNAEYFIPAGAPDAAALRRRLDRVASGRLPDELARSLSAVGGDDNAVVRIRQLSLDLWVDALAMSDADIARAWGGLAARGVARALVAGPPAEVVRYDDPAHFVAAFLVDLLAGAAWSRWMYAEFTPLRDLPPSAVAAQLLSARPALLIPVAKRLDQTRQLEALISRMQVADVRLILRTGLGFDAAPAAVPDDAGALLDLLRGHVALERGGDPGVQARNTLRAYLAAMLHGLPSPSRSVLAVSYHLALLHALWSARPAPALWSALAAGEIEDAGALQPLLASLGQELESARTWLGAALATATGRAYLARLLPIAVPGIHAPEPIDSQRRADTADRARQQRTASAFAGLALLLPVLRELALAEELGRPGIYQLLLAAAGRRLLPLAAGDLGVAWLAGLLPQEMAGAPAEAVPWPDIARWQAPASVDAGSEAAAAHLGQGPAAAFAWLALRRFARGLHGFAESSPGYLAAQFLNVAGELHWRADALEVRISQAPLRVVLHMAGRSGEQGAIPWLGDRQLIIHLPE